MSLQPTGNQLTIRLYKKRCLVGLQKGILCKSIGRLFKDRRATIGNNKPPPPQPISYKKKEVQETIRGGYIKTLPQPTGVTRISLPSLWGAVRAETAVILPFYVKYFYELTILSVSCE